MKMCINMLVYDDAHKTALGYQKPLYLRKTQRNQPVLYSAKALTKKHDSISMRDSKETLILAEESRLKMKDKQKQNDDKPIDYTKLNKLYEYFVPQKQLSADEVYWSHVSKPTPFVSVVTPTPTKVFPKKLPTTSMVKENLQKAKDHLEKFDACIKNITVLSGVQVRNWGVMHIKGAFEEDVIPFFQNLRESFKLFEMVLYKEVNEMKVIFTQMENEVDQFSVEKKYFKIEKKQLLINNDRLLEENISCDIMCTFLRSLNKVDNCGNCERLEIELLNYQESNKSFNELSKHFSKLEEYCISLELSLQHNEEKMICDKF
ncbi:hypothetical protein Tco_0667197 [Tanacetum coccineum]